MAQQNTVEVTDQSGWRRMFSLQKNITYIGSDPDSDIVLEEWRSAGVAPRHLQLIHLPGQGYHLVNLGDTNVRMGDSGGVIPPHSSTKIAAGESVRLGSFTVIFHVGGAATPADAPSSAAGDEIAAPSGITGDDETSETLGLALSLPQTTLGLDRPIEGTITVSNLGDQTGVQFKLEVEGLDADCYEVGPGPILFPGAEREVPLRLRHSRRPSPPAGDYRIRVRATAPGAYPGKSVSVSRVIQIAPFYDYELNLFADKKEMPDVPVAEESSQDDLL